MVDRDPNPMVGAPFHKKPIAEAPLAMIIFATNSRKNSQHLIPSIFIVVVDYCHRYWLCFAVIGERTYILFRLNFYFLLPPCSILFLSTTPAIIEPPFVSFFLRLQPSNSDDYLVLLCNTMIFHPIFLFKKIILQNTLVEILFKYYENISNFTVLSKQLHQNKCSQKPTPK